MLIHTVASLSTAGGGELGLAGDTGIVVVQGGGSANVGVRLNIDGTLDERKNGVYTQLNPTVDWVIPNASAQRGTFYVRVTNNGDALDLSSDGTGVWLTLDQEREWWVVQSSVGTKTLNLSIEVGRNGSTAEAGPTTYSGYAQIV